MAETQLNSLRMRLLERNGQTTEKRKEEKLSNSPKRSDSSKDNMSIPDKCKSEKLAKSNTFAQNSAIYTDECVSGTGKVPSFLFKTVVFRLIFPFIRVAFIRDGQYSGMECIC